MFLRYSKFIAVLILKLIVKYFVQPLHSPSCDVILLRNCLIGRIWPIIISIILFLFTNECVLGVGPIRCESNSVVLPESKQDLNARCFTVHGLPIGVLYKNRGTVQLKYDCTRWRTGGGGGKWRVNWRMEWVASTLHTTAEHGVSSNTTADAHNSAASSRLNWRPPADLNGLVRFAERRNLVSARLPSHFKRSLLNVIEVWDGNGKLLSNLNNPNMNIDYREVVGRIAQSV